MNPGMKRIVAELDALQAEVGAAETRQQQRHKK